MLECKYEMGQLVYVKTDTDQRPKMVIGIFFQPGGVRYDLSPGGWYYEIEMSETKDVLMATTNH